MVIIFLAQSVLIWLLLCFNFDLYVLSQSKFVYKSDFSWFDLSKRELAPYQRGSMQEEYVWRRKIEVLEMWNHEVNRMWQEF